MSRTMVDYGFPEPEGLEGLERLKIPQSSFTLNRSPRPPPTDMSGEAAQARAPLNAPKLNRQESKSRIRGIFNRHKAERAILIPTVEDGLPSLVNPEVPIKAIERDGLEGSKAVPQGALMSPVTPSKSVSKSSRMTLRGRTSKLNKQSPIPIPSAKSSTRLTRTSATWDPPPLFQAYPQAIKHAQLAASTLSADSIIRISNHKRNGSRTEYGPFPAFGAEREQTPAAAKKIEKARSKHRRQVSGSISKADWTQKIFVLVTSGYLLQYASDGSFDRLPEKMMLLGKDSVAFASDAIPGKHWVLQISQSIDEHGTPASDSRSLFSRLTFRGSDYKRTATSLLLVLDSAEEMDSWIAVVRREIEALGGKKYASDGVKPKADEKVMQLQEKPSDDYLVQNSPDSFSNPSSPSNLSFGTRPWDRTDSMKKMANDVGPPLDGVQASIRSTTNLQSASNSIVSQDGQALDELRNSGQLHRLSYVSSGQRTFVTSQFSSRETSPTRESSVTNFEDPTPKASMEECRPRPNASAVSERRRSMQTVPLQALQSQSQQTSKTHRHSTFGPVATPNFSVPNSSSRRFSTVKAHSGLPGIGMSTVRSTEMTVKGARKAPPPSIAVSRPLSPVTDDPSPLKSTICVNLGSSVNPVQQTTPSIDRNPRTPLFTPSLMDNKSPQQSNRLQRRASHAPLRTPSPSHIDFQFPRRASSVITSPTRAKNATDRGKRANLVIPEARTVQMAEQNPELALLPAIANTKTKLRRPTSMQIRPPPTFSTGAFSGLQPRTPNNKMAPPVSSTNQISQANRPPPLVPPKERANSPALKPMIATPVQHPHATPKSLANRRSMPFLVGGPPPAPPPDCALPALPPPGGIRTGSSSSVRTAMRA